MRCKLDGCAGSGDEAAINQQRVTALEQRVEQMHVDAHKARVALNQMRQAISGPMGKVQLGLALKSGAVSTPRVQPHAEAAWHRARLRRPVPSPSPQALPCTSA